MAEQSKFSSALSRLKERPADQAVEPQPGQPVLSSAVLVKGKGRPSGKRSDPDCQATTVLLRKQTKKQANRKLEDEETGQDLSELIEQLLIEWIEQRT